VGYNLFSNVQLKAPEQHFVQQREFVKRLVLEIRAGREIVYMDETSTNTWANRVKVWQ